MEATGRSRQRIQERDSSRRGPRSNGFQAVRNASDKAAEARPSAGHQGTIST